METAMKAENLTGLHKIIYGIVASAQGKKNIKYMDVQKTILKDHPEFTAYNVKMAVKDLVDNGLLTYEYRGGSYLVIPHEDPAAKNI